MASPRRESCHAPQHLILDSGAVIALAREDFRARAFLAKALKLMAPVEIPVVVVAETVRGGPRDATVNRVLKAVASVPEAREIHGRTARRILAAARSASTVDALVVAHAVEREEPRSSPGTLRISVASRRHTPRCGSIIFDGRRQAPLAD